jgi:elongation factor 1 alpha-like protein
VRHLIHRGSHGRIATDTTPIVYPYMKHANPPPPMTIVAPFIPVDFWKDMGWLNIPLDRQTTFVEPLCHPGGLLGGSPDGAPKMSKLQALAAARKKKAQEQKNGTGAEEVTKPMASLSIGKGNTESSGSGSVKPSNATPTPVMSGRENARTYPGLKRKDSSPHRRTSRPAEPIKDTFSHEATTPEVEAAAPSAFAMTMFGDATSSPRQSFAAAFTLPYSDPRLLSTDAFAGPSPDDVVIAAQLKGSAQRGIPRN